MPRQVYTVELDGHQYDIEGDRPPSEAEARAAIGTPDPHIVNGRRISDESIPADQQPPVPSYLHDVGQYALGELKGAGNAALGMIDPRTYAPYAKDLVMSGPIRAGLHMGKDVVEGAVNTGRGIVQGDPEAMGAGLFTAASLKGIPAAAEGISNIPAGRIFSAGWEGAKAGAAKVPIVGPPMKAAIQGARQSWAASAPAAEAVEAAAPTAYPMPSGPAFEPQATKMAPPAPKIVPEGSGPAPMKPRLNAQQTAQMLREQYGSEEASRMLYGRSNPSALPRGDAQAAIKRLAPGESRLPMQAQRAIAQGIQEGTPGEAWNYAQAAPNDLARQYLISLMRGK